MSNSNKNIGADLENVQDTKKLSKNSAKNAPQFSDFDWLTKNNPIEFISDENKSSKFDAEREVKIQNALPTLEKIQIDSVSINPLLLLLGKWWEVKPARAAIKKMIDAEAEAKGFDANDYLQNVLGKEVEVFSEMQATIDRVRYAKTYFKPRKAINAKVITKLININDVVYIVPVAQFEALKATIKNVEELKLATIAISTPQQSEIESL